MMVDELKQQLAAAEEQLAAMHDASEELEGVIFGWLAAEDGYDEGLIESCGYRLRNARLAAAPKRGRVIFEETYTTTELDNIEYRYALDMAMTEIVAEAWASDYGITVTVRKAE